jgi:hypothetical protein
MSRASELIKVIEGLTDTITNIARGTLGPGSSIILGDKENDDDEEKKPSLLDTVKNIAPAIQTAAKFIK